MKITSLSSRISSAVLRGRSIISKPASAKPHPLTPDEAKANLAKYAGFLTRLAEARAALDAAQALSDEAQTLSGDELAMIFLESGDLPSPGSLEEATDGGKLLTGVIKQALDKLTPGAVASISRLQSLKTEKLKAVESEIRTRIQRPEWMAEKDFALSIARSPALARVILARDIHAPQMPLSVIGDNETLLPGQTRKPTTVGLGFYRTRPLDEWERKHVSRSNDDFDARQLSASITRWLAHLEEVEAMGGDQV